MGRMTWFGVLALFLTGCVSESQERMQAHNENGLRLFQQGKYNDVRQSFESALDLKKDDAGLLYNVGECYDRLGDGANAERYYNECLQRSPNHGPCRHALTVLLVREGRGQDAVNMVQAWLVHEPQLPDALVEDAWLWRQSGNLPNAKTRVEEALEKEPRNNRALIELAQIYETMHRPERALDLYQRCLEQNPRQPEVAARVQILLTQLKPEERRVKPD